MNALNPVITIGEQLIDVVLAHEDVTPAGARSQAIKNLDLVGIHASRMEFIHISYPEACVSAS